MRFICPACKFDEKEDAGLTPLAVRCPGCGTTWSPSNEGWRWHSGPRSERARAKAAPAVLAAEQFMTIWGTRPVRA